MTGAANSERIDAYILEVTPGTTPATPAFTKLSATDFNMTANPRVTEPRLQAFGTQRSGVGQHGIAVNGTLTAPLLYGEFDDFLASLFQDNWASDIITNGTGDQIAMTVEQSIPQGVGGALSYLRYKGVEAVNGSIVLTAGEDATLAFDVVGFASDDAATVALSGSTYSDPSNTNVLGSGSDIGSITMTGLGTIDCMQSLTIDWGGVEKEEQLKISSDDGCGLNRGVILPVLTGQFYIEDNFVAVYNHARSGTEFAVNVPIGSVTTEKYTINFPKCKLAEAPLLGAPTGPAFQPFRILPYYDSGISGTCRITRAVA